MTIAVRQVGAGRKVIAALGLLTWATASQAAEVDGRSLGLLWALPFAGVLLSIALLPLAAPMFWHRHFGKVAMAWMAAFVLPYAVAQGLAAAGMALVHVVLAEYVPFIILLVALYTASGGIYVRGNLHGSPALNTGILALGAALASIMGTTGASMLLIRPLIRANDNRRHVVHVFVFFIFIVSNVGGSLTPLGDPPLFLGFLKGISFFWPTKHLAAPALFVVGCLLTLFFIIDRYWYRKEGILRVDPTPDTPKFGVDGAGNAWVFAGVIGLVLLSGYWRPGVSFHWAGTTVELQSLVRDLGLLVLTGLSLWRTPLSVRQGNQFSWGPMAEVAKLFIAIFVTMVPVLAMLKAGSDGAFASVARGVSDAQGQPLNWAYFWFAGGLSSFLDNAPTYLVFFNLASGDANVLMGPLASTLVAISAGSVFMGANSYIGNAPNFMVKAIVEERNLRMPSFLGYMLWSSCILLPLFGLVTWIWFL